MCICPYGWKIENSCSYSLASGSNCCVSCSAGSTAPCSVASTITLVYSWLWGYIRSKYGENFQFHGMPGSVSHCTNSASSPLMQELKYHPFQPCYRPVSWPCFSCHLTSGCLVTSPTEKESQTARGYICTSILVWFRHVLLKWRSRLHFLCFGSQQSWYLWTGFLLDEINPKDGPEVPNS